MSAVAKLIEELASLEKRWSNLTISIRTNEDFDDAAFNVLIKSTLETNLDFRFILFANQEIEKLKANIKIIISALQLQDNLNDLLIIALNTDKWDSTFGLALLSGKLIGNASKFIPFEKKLQIESDDVIKTRLDSLLRLLLNTNYDDDTGQVVLNVYESYRKMLLRDVRFQCKFSNEAFQKLAKNYLIALCHKKQFDHLSSAIKLFPLHRKFKFVCDLQKDQKLGPCHAHILEGFMEDLLRREFKKDKSLQDIQNLSLYISKVIEIASQSNIEKHFNLEKLLLSVNTDVISDYYYLAATHLRIWMPNRYNDFVLKLISIGLSHDISYLEQIKYADNNNFKMRDEMFKTTYRRIFQALIILGYLIKNYTVRRLCFEAAKVCEVDSYCCEKLLNNLPDCGDINDTNDLDQTLLDIRYQLETFQNDIRSNINLPNNFAKNSNNIYETLIYFNHRVPLNDDLKPLEYPGVEKYLKKQAFEDQDHISKTSDLENCLHESDNYNAQLSERLKKNLQNFFKSPNLPLKKRDAPSNEVIQKMCEEIFPNSLPDFFKIIANCGLFGEMFTVKLQNLLVESYDSYEKRYNVIKSEHEANNLFFDFDSTNDEIDNSNDVDEIDTLYLSGTIPVKKLFDKGFGSHDVENILLYAIMEKKMKYIPAEFEFFNKNRNVEVDVNQNQVYAGLLYLLNKPHPEYARLMRLSSALMRFANCMDYILDTYIMDATPGKFKYKLKHLKITKPKLEANSPPQSNEIEMSIPILNMNSNQFSTDNNVIETVNNNNLGTAENLSSEINKQITNCTINKITKKPKPVPSITLNANDTLNVSNEILNIFYNIKQELLHLTGKNIFLDLSKVSDMSSSNNVYPLQSVTSSVSIKIVRTRNGRVDPREKIIEIKMPLLVNGKLILTNEIRDEIEYDEFLDNPKIKSSLIYRLSGALTVENLSHNIKFELDCRIDNVPSKIKFIFQGIRTSRPRKKPVQMSDNHHLTMENKLQLSNNAAAITQSTTNTFLQQSNSNNANTPTTSNNMMMMNSKNDSVPLNSYTNNYSNSQSCLPSFGTINSASYIPQVMPKSTNLLPNQYSISSQSNLTNNAIIIAAEIQTFIKEEPIINSQDSMQNVSSYHHPVLAQVNHEHPEQKQFIIDNIQNIHIDPVPTIRSVKSEKAKILSVEDVSSLKLSFSNPCIIAKEENNSHKCDKVIKQLVNNDLVDFEDAIQKSAVIPKKKNVHIDGNQCSQMKQLLLSPPPLHYPSSELPVLPKCEPIVIKQEQLTPVKEIQSKFSPTNDKTMKTLKSPSAYNENTTSIPLISNTHQLTSNVIMKKKSLHEMNGKRNLYDNKFKVEEFIDLTDDSVDNLKDNLEIQFVSCESKPVTYDSSDQTIKNYRINASGRRVRTGIKRSISQDERKSLRECKVHILDAMRNINKEVLKKETMIELKPYNSEKFYKNRVSKMHNQYEYEAEEVPVEEMPIENFADDPYDAVFTIVFQSSVSFLFNENVIRGDGIANCFSNQQYTDSFSIASYNYNKTKITNDINEIVNKFINLKNTNNNNNNINFELISIENVEKILKKTLYSDKNHLNFTKNLKNRKKFAKWTPKVSNCSNILNDKKFVKTFFNDEKNHKSLLYQVSHQIINSIPGMHSMEFFKMPSPFRSSLQIEVVHLKDIKDTSTAATNETSDINDGISNEPMNLHQNDSNNGDVTKIHIQKIGQTSISHDTETRALHTSFGSIIKNTYPPATSRVFSNEKERLPKMKNDEGSITKISIGESTLKTNQNIKIIACTPQQQQQELPKITNKNQTLINMLTQQVMVPTNNNRHYIITNATKSSDNKQETGTSCTLTSTSNQSNSSSVRRTITSAVGQSQLVQILNSPPSNFTMKSLNTINTSTNSNTTITKPSQSSSPAITTVEGLKAELPNSIKQQGIVQFICKTDGKIIHLTPICNNTATGGISKKITYKVDTTGAKGPTILHHANQQIILNNQLRKDENPNILTIIQKQGDNTPNTDKKLSKGTIVGISPSQNNPTSPISTRSSYEENYAKFIQTPSSTASIATNSSDMGLLTISSSPINSGSTNANTFIQKIGKTVIQSSNQILPKFNQAFGKTVFSSSSLTEPVKSNKVTLNRETITKSTINSISPLTKITAKTEFKVNDRSFVSLIENESIEKPGTTTLPTLQSTLQNNNLLYARSIENGKLVASNNNNVLLTALRNSVSSTSNNVRIISSLPDSMSSKHHRTIMTPVRISVPIQIPQLINSVRPQSPGNFRSQIFIAATPPSSIESVSGISSHVANTTLIRPQTSIQSQTVGSKLQSLLMGAQSSTASTVSTITSTNNQEVETEISKTQITKIDQKHKKNVDNSTLEQLREFDMVLEQVLERSSITPNSISSPPRPDSANLSSPRKQINENAKKMEIKSSSASLASNSPNDSPTSSKSLSNNSIKSTTPKLQEDEHTAQRILDILANYKEQVRNSPDLNNKPAPRRRANPPSNLPAKRKKIAASSNSNSMKNSKRFGSSSDVMTDNTIGSEEDSSCGVGSGIASTGSMNNSPRGDIDDHTDASLDNNFYMEDTKREVASSPQSSNSSITTSPAHNKFSLNRRLHVSEAKSSNYSSVNSFVDSNSSKSLIISNSQSSISNASSATRTSSIGESIEKLSAQGSTTAVLMPGNYILPMNVLKSGQHLAILSSNNGQKIIAVPASQLASSSSTSGTSIILQRYVNQINENGVSNLTGDKTSKLVHKTEMNESKKGLRLQQNLSLNSNSYKNQHAFYVKPIDNIKQETKSESQKSSLSSNFVSDKTLITEIIQQQQQLLHNHPQHNFMIKLNETSDSRNSSSIMFMADNETNNKNFETNNMKIKTEKKEINNYVKEEIVDINVSQDHEIFNSPMLTTKMEVDENTNSNHDVGDIDNKSIQKFPSILNSCLTKQVITSMGNVDASENEATSSKHNIVKGFLLDPSSKILMYNDRNQNNMVDKEIFNPKSFSEECADLGVDEPIASDLFPEADLLFDSGSPKFDQINPNDGAIQIKRELENGEVLLQMIYNHNITEPWLNCFDTEDDLDDDSHDESGDNGKGSGLLKNNHF